MNPTITAAIVTALFGGMSSVVAVWLRQRAKSQKAREEARRDHLRVLPPGSHVVDLGGRGIVIEIGGRAIGDDGHSDVAS